MNHKSIIYIALSVLLSMSTALKTEARQWTLQQCLEYAAKNNISLQKASITRQSSHEDFLQSKSALLPSLDASTSHGAVYRPFPESGHYQVSNGTVQSSVDKLYYNGNYAVNFSWTVWDGNKLRNQVKLNNLTEQQAIADSAVTAKNIQEQIMQLYIQILYAKEAVTINQSSFETSKANEERAIEMQKVGSISKADVAELTAQRANDEYNIVASQADVKNYTRQLKQLLELTDNEDFDVVSPYDESDNALAEIPSLETIYNQALANRPEIRSAQLAIDANEVSINIAKAQRMPTLSFSAGVGTSNTSMSDELMKQLKYNFNTSAGLTLSIPIFDNRKTKTAVNKARLSLENSQLELKNQQTQLHSTIESYWIQAVTNQSKYKAALTNTQSQQTSYELLSGKFQSGLVNIVELMTGKTNLVQAQQNELQSKYMTLYNMQMLKFYEN